MGEAEKSAARQAVIEIFDAVEQGSEEWRNLRRGLPTASNFKAIVAKSTERKMRATYMRRLAAEIITGKVLDSYTNSHIERGKAGEDEPLAAYEFLTGYELRRVGFIRNGRLGASPDALVGEDGGLEIKTQLPDLLIQTIENDKFPVEHIAQCQGNMLASGRQWWDIVIYWPGMPIFRRRTFRDIGYLAYLRKEIDIFNRDLDALVARITAYDGFTLERKGASDGAAA